MKLQYKDPGYMYSAKSIIEFIGQSEFVCEPIYHFIPKLIKYKGSDNRDGILEIVAELYNSKQKEIENKVTSYQDIWNHYEKLINDRFSLIFNFDTSNIFNDLVCNITLNPISPRYLKEHVFDVFYMNSAQGSVGSALHELVHYLWFNLWNHKYNDLYEQYEIPSLIWVLSEAVVEQILNDEEFNNINPYHKSGNAYPCFYNMIIKGRPLYDYLNEIYKKNTIDTFMDKSYQYMVDNEEEIRRQML